MLQDWFIRLDLQSIVVPSFTLLWLKPLTWMRCYSHRIAQQLCQMLHRDHVISLKHTRSAIYCNMVASKITATRNFVKCRGDFINPRTCSTNTWRPSSEPRANFTDNDSSKIQIRWKDQFVLTRWSDYTHLVDATAARQLWHVQIFVTIWQTCMAQDQTVHALNLNPKWNNIREMIPMSNIIYFPVLLNASCELHCTMALSWNQMYKLV